MEQLSAEPLRDALGSLLRQVLRVALRTVGALLVACALVGGVTAFGAYHLAAHGGHGALGVAFTIALTLAVAPFIAFRGAVGAAAPQALESVGAAGFLASRVQRAMLHPVAASSIAVLREAGDDGGGVDLVCARESVEALVEARLAFGLRRTLATWTVLLFSVLVLGSLGSAWLLGR